MNELNEVLMYYHVEENISKPICIIMQQLDVKVMEIKDEDIHHTMGYLLKVPGFKPSEEEGKDIPKDSFLFFAGMSGEQIDIILDIFKNAKIPYIPYKAMLTNDNIQYPFYVLYENVKQEYLNLVNQK